MNKFFFIVIFSFLSITSYSQKGKYISYPCRYEMWYFLNDSVVFVRSDLSFFLFSYSIKSDTIRVEKVSNQLLKEYEKQKRFKNISSIINLFEGGYGIHSPYDYINDIHNLILIKKRRRMLISLNCCEIQGYYIIVKKNVIKGLYNYLYSFIKIKILGQCSCHILSDRYENIRNKFKKRINKYFPFVKQQNPNYDLIW